MTEKNTSGPLCPPRILNSWKEIADYLRCGVRTVQRYERDQRLPVRRPYGRLRSSVIALSDELDAWLRDPTLSSARCGNSSDGIHEKTTQALYEGIVDAAVRIMGSEFASLQMLFPERGTGGELRLLAFRGFNPAAATFWEWVRADSRSTCGIALVTGKRAVAPDIATCEYMADSEDQRVYLQTGIHACQTTPLIGQSGNIVGMISSHWRTARQPSERDFRQFGNLATQAAELIERSRRDLYL